MVLPYTLTGVSPSFMEVIGFLAAAILSWWITGRVRRWAIAKAILDIPNARSSHSLPVPRGGGLAIAAVVLGVNAVAAVVGDISRAVAAIIWISTACYAVLGALDDYRSIRPEIRLVFQTAFSLVCVYSLFAVTMTPFNVLTVCLGVLLSLVLIWSVNLYNFMDGSDGLAAVQAVTAGIAGAVLSGYLNFDGVAFAAASIAGASAGFLWWNWQPAQIFLGDVGSYFLGACFGLLILVTALHGLIPFFWIILLSPFITDATLTLFRRIISGENWRAAHRTHAYQLLVQVGWSHRKVALGLVFLMVLVAYPGAWLSVAYPQYGFECAALVYVLIATLWAIIIKRADFSR